MSISANSFINSSLLDFSDKGLFVPDAFVKDIKDYTDSINAPNNQPNPIPPGNIYPKNASASEILNTTIGSLQGLGFSIGEDVVGLQPRSVFNTSGLNTLFGSNSLTGSGLFGSPAIFQQQQPPIQNSFNNNTFQIFNTALFPTNTNTQTSGNPYSGSFTPTPSHNTGNSARWWMPPQQQQPGLFNGNAGQNTGFNAMYQFNVFLNGPISNTVNNYWNTPTQQQQSLQQPNYTNYQHPFTGNIDFCI